MSRTFKFTLIAALAFSTIGAQAQEQGKQADSALLSALTGNMSPDEAAPSKLRSEIENRIRSIMEEVKTSPLEQDGPPMTIEEIDRINRSAERERTELEFEKARFERMQLEIERLLALYEAVKTIEGDRQQNNAENKAKLVEMIGGKDAKQPPAQSPENDELELLPRIDSIAGIGGAYTAEAEFENGTFKTLKTGDTTVNDFVVEDIQSSHVVLRGPRTGTLYRMTPKAPKRPAQAVPGSRIGEVIDLSQFPMAQF